MFPALVLCTVLASCSLGDPTWEARNETWALDRKWSCDPHLLGIALPRRASRSSRSSSSYIITSHMGVATSLSLPPIVRVSNFPEEVIHSDSSSTCSPKFWCGLKCYGWPSLICILLFDLLGLCLTAMVLKRIKDSTLLAVQLMLCAFDLCPLGKGACDGLEVGKSYFKINFGESKRCVPGLNRVGSQLGCWSICETCQGLPLAVFPGLALEVSTCWQDAGRVGKKIFVTTLNQSVEGQSVRIQHPCPTKRQRKEEKMQRRFVTCWGCLYVSSFG